MAAKDNVIASNKKAVKYNKWGYIFLVPFFVAFIIFNLIPLGMTFVFSFFEYFRDGIYTVGPNFVGVQNYIDLFYDGFSFDPSIFKYLGNTLLMWVMGFIPQIIVSLVLAQWFSDNRLALKGSRFFKTVIYLPNLIMASAFAMLFRALFAATGPISELLQNIGWIKTALDYTADLALARWIIAFMNFLMWFGNTTILLMAGILGIDESLYEAAEVDGANSIQRFTRITLPLLKPILVYVVITSLIGGIQMYDVPQIFTKGSGNPAQGTKTLIMYLNEMISPSKNFGKGGAYSVILFLITGGLSLLVFKMIYSKKEDKDGGK